MQYGKKKNETEVSWSLKIRGLRVDYPVRESIIIALFFRLSDSHFLGKTKSRPISANILLFFFFTFFVVLFIILIHGGAFHQTFLALLPLPARYIRSLAPQLLPVALFVACHSPAHLNVSFSRDASSSLGDKRTKLASTLSTLPLPVRLNLSNLISRCTFIFFLFFSSLSLWTSPSQ